MMTGGSGSNPSEHEVFEGVRSALEPWAARHPGIADVVRVIPYLEELTRRLRLGGRKPADLRFIAESQRNLTVFGRFSSQEVLDHLDPLTIRLGEALERAGAQPWSPEDRRGATRFAVYSGVAKRGEAIFTTHGWRYAGERVCGPAVAVCPRDIRLPHMQGESWRHSRKWKLMAEVLLDRHGVPRYLLRHDFLTGLRRYFTFVIYTPGLPPEEQLSCIHLIGDLLKEEFGYRMFTVAKSGSRGALLEVPWDGKETPVQGWHLPDASRRAEYAIFPAVRFVPRSGAIRRAESPPLPPLRRASDPQPAEPERALRPMARTPRREPLPPPYRLKERGPSLGPFVEFLVKRPDLTSDELKAWDEVLDDLDTDSEDAPPRDHRLSELLVLAFDYAQRLDGGVCGEQCEALAESLEPLAVAEDFAIVRDPLAQFGGRPPEGLCDYVKSPETGLLRPGALRYDPASGGYNVLLCARIGIPG